jgi:hypothetical protein
VRGVVLALWEIVKSNSIRARCEEHQVVGRIKVLELLCKHSLWWRELVCSPLARGSATTLDLPQRGLSSWQTTEPQDKNLHVIIFLLVCNSLHKPVFTCSYIVLALLLLCLLSLYSFAI